MTDLVRTRPRLEFALVREAARGRWGEVLPTLSIGERFLSRRHGPCPGCGGIDRFRFDDRDGTGSFICSSGGGTLLAGDGFALLAHVHGWSLAEVLQQVAACLRLDPRGCEVRRAEPEQGRAAILATMPKLWSERARAIWDRSVPLAGTLGEAYLRGRRCVLPPPDGDLRFLPPFGEHLPALVARVTDVRTAGPMTLHFTPLVGNGRAERKLLAGHAKAHGVIRLWPDEAVTLGLGLAEGIETALTLALAFEPVWASIDSGNLGRLPVLAGVASLVIAQDGDRAGRTASESLARRWREARREAVVIELPDGTDLNDAVQGDA